MIRDDLITQITTNLTSYTEFNVVSDLPYDASGTPLYQKNFKTVYIDEQEDTKTQLYRTLDQGEVFQTDTVVNAYVTVDAKNQPSDIDNVITGILNAKSVVTNTQLNEATYETEIEDDYITYTFEYNFTNV
jgi:hypothetical protein